jgi:radical SAM superfamily enzyme YgiQ (UPF0313 family)
MNILAINPWIYDFAAYDFWLKPYGFLVLLTYLKNKGVKINYIDCLDKKVTHDNFGRGKYHSEIIPKPPLLSSIPRRFKRYGMPPEELDKSLPNKRPDFILITSSMTYWYPAIEEISKILKTRFPKVPIILGGTYASLIPQHARALKLADFLFKNSQIEKFFHILGLRFDFDQFYSTLPNYEEFYSRLDYVVLRTSWGCPFSCSYCAIKKLFGGFFRISQDKILKFILRYYHKGVKDFVLYDDAFLYQPDYAKTLLGEIKRLNLEIRFHTPNALHLRFLDSEIASLLRETGFINPHFGLETLNKDLQKLWGDKVTTQDVIQGIEFLKKAGFGKGEFSLYLLLGYPNQNLEELKREVNFLHHLGAKVSLAEFSIVPGTKIFKYFKEKFSEPLLHNNSIFSFFPQSKLTQLWRIKNYVRQLNKKLNSSH